MPSGLVNERFDSPLKSNEEKLDPLKLNAMISAKLDSKTLTTTVAMEFERLKFVSA